MAFFLRLTINAEGDRTACVNMDNVWSMQESTKGYTSLKFSDDTSLNVKEKTETIMSKLHHDHQGSV
jgi:hypothetical protein